MIIADYLWHPVFVHFSVALLSIAGVLFVLTAVFPDARQHKHWLIVAEWNLWIGMGITALTVLFGWIAFNTVNHDDTSHEPMVTHARLALVTASGFLLLTLWSIWHRRSKHYPSLLFVGLVVVCVALLLVTGWRGGELVYRYGMAVIAKPKLETGLPAGGQATSPGTNSGSRQHVHPDGKAHAH